MILIANESLVPLSDVPQRLPPRPSGRPIHLSTIYRWTQCGIRGVLLETIRIGGTNYTSTEALQRFADCLSRPMVVPSVSKPPMTAARVKQIEEASKAVDAILAGRDTKQRNRRAKNS